MALVQGNVLWPFCSLCSMPLPLLYSSIGASGRLFCSAKRFSFARASGLGSDGHEFLKRPLPRCGWPTLAPCWPSPSHLRHASPGFDHCCSEGLQAIRRPNTSAIRLNPSVSCLTREDVEQCGTNVEYAKLQKARPHVLTLTVLPCFFGEFTSQIHALLIKLLHKARLRTGRHIHVALFHFVPDFTIWAWLTHADFNSSAEIEPEIVENCSDALVPSSVALVSNSKHCYY